MATSESDTFAAQCARQHAWACGDTTFDLLRPLVMGILNVTPDSFSDGGRFQCVESAVEHAFAMRDAGADIIDVGGESTRPRAESVGCDQEIARVLPVVRAIAAAGVPVSIDTRHAETAAACIDVGACIINDVSGFRSRAMVRLAAATDVGIVVMHMLGEPETMQAKPYYQDVTAEIATYLTSRASELEAEGVSPARICIDPGIGFGKTLDHNLEILRNTERFAGLGYPLLIGASRKRMIGEILNADDPLDRLEGSLAIAAWVVARGAGIVRVHDVAETVRVVRVTSAIVDSE